MIVLRRVAMSMRVMQRPPKSAPCATIIRPLLSKTMPFDMELGDRNTSVLPLAGSCTSRWPPCIPLSHVVVMSLK